MHGLKGLRGSVALVVGGSSGMGRAAVDLLKDEGCRTHVVDIQECEAAAFHRCDVGDYAQVRAAVAAVLHEEGRIDRLLITAGIHLFATIEETGLEEFERLLSINLAGTFHMLKEVLPAMRERQSGTIVLMGSDQVLIGKGSSAAYGMSKAAVGQLTKSTAIDYAPQGIRVNCICPGTIDTPMLGPTVERFHRASGTPIEDIHAMLRQAQPIRRLGTPEEIARLALFLLSDECAYMTGALVSADGGYTSQ